MFYHFDLISVLYLYLTKYHQLQYFYSIVYQHYLQFFLLNFQPLYYLLFLFIIENWTEDFLLSIVYLLEIYQLISSLIVSSYNLIYVQVLLAHKLLALYGQELTFPSFFPFLFSIFSNNE